MNKKFYFLNSLLFLILFSMFIWVKVTTPKIAYVNTSLVLEKYKGIAEVEKLIEKKAEDKHRDLQILHKSYVDNLNTYIDLKEKGNLDLLQEQQIVVQNLKNEYENAKLKMENYSDAETEKLLQGVLNQINNYVEGYAQKHNIDIVIGITPSGNLLYGKVKLDITENIITGLNAEY